MYTWYTIQTQYWLFDYTYVTVIKLIPSQWIHQILGSVAIEDTPSFVGHLLHQVSDSAYWLHNHLQVFVLQNVLVDTLAEESISVSGRPMNHCWGQHISVYFCCRRSQQTQNSFQFNWPQHDLPACNLIVPISRFPGVWGRETRWFPVRGGGNPLRPAAPLHWAWLVAVSLRHRVHECLQ